MGQEATPELEGAAAAVVPAEEPTTQVKPGLKLYDLTQFLPEMEPDVSYARVGLCILSSIGNPS